MPTLKISSKSEISFVKELLKPYTKRAYLVGGSVRDLLLGLKINDFDIEIYDISPKKFDEIMQKIGANGVGRSFFVYKFQNYDFALARSENKISSGHKGFEVEICNDEKIAAKRRDFTFNALMINIFDDTLLDFYGGLKDLEKGVIRHINTQSFKEDSLRVLRAIDFASRFDFRIENESLELMQNMDISDLSKDRINAELYKIFKNKNLILAYEYLQILKLEKQIFHANFDDENFKTLLKNTRKFIHHEALFLYLYLNFFKINKKEFFKKTGLKKELLKQSEQDFYFDEPSDFELAKIAFSMPLKSWLGLWNEERIQRAKNLGLYECIFESKISAKTLLHQGICGKILGEKLKLLKENELKNYLKTRKKGQK